MSETRYRKKPVEVEAIEYTGDFVVIQEWCRDQEPDEHRAFFFPVDEEDCVDDPEIVAEVYDKLHSTWVGVKLGQWIIHGIQGEFYPCDADVFAETYESVEASA